MTVIDSAQLALLPGDLRIHRVLDPSPEAWLQRRKAFVPNDLAKAPPRQSQAASRRLDNVALTVLLVAARPFVRKWLSTPDVNRLWAAAAAKYIVDLMREGKRDAVVSSSPAYSCHLAGLEVKRHTGIPWVADFTDLWVGRPGSMSSRTGWQARMDARMEAEVVRHADRIIVASPPWKDRLGNRYGPRVFEKIRCVTLGFDSTRLRGVSPPADSDLITFVCTGAMYGTESPVPFLDSLGSVLRSSSKRNVRVRLIGSAGDEGDKIREAIRRNSLEDVVAFMGPQPHAFCMEEQAKADVLVLFNGPAHVETIRGRSYEYMASGKRILAVTPAHGAQAAILRPTRTAVIVDYEDRRGLAAAIEQLVDRATLRPSPNWDYIRRFDAPNITRQLVEVLDELSAAPAHG
jgi:glycosyltransferase involved in cell wall biosynthesis